MQGKLVIKEAKFLTSAARAEQFLRPQKPMIAVCGRTPLAEAGYLCVRAFMLAEFAASLEWQLYTYIVQTVPGWGVWLRVLVPAVVFAGVYLLLYWLESRRRGQEAAGARVPSTSSHTAWAVRPSQRYSTSAPLGCSTPKE